ncbi:DUF6515 family protein [Winogradskyella aurantia]|uniref:Uncharacterized protein n=1 Tax=Winogradskyella aurantia TaxID=1915063 RepID=A0A265UZN3_9FLAO|nr:DUF6515 family protein [Winogradskyella aurantia]OZV70778.1 hypothetical protein CA834_01305 [Winogradskyella aurantia]
MMKYVIYTLILVSGLTLNSCASRVVVQPQNSVTVVTKLPRNYKVVRVNGYRYYYFNGRHYKKTKRGYIAVRA